MARGWPVGEVLGAEAELLDRYHVSRAVFREAVRLVEHQQVARTRRGPGGGLVITEPTVDAVIEAVVLYLHRVDARLDEVFEARLVLEDLATALAVDRALASDRAVLADYAKRGAADRRADPRTLHSQIASASRNPAIELFVDVLNQVSMLYSSDWQTWGPKVGGETAHAHTRIAQAVLAGDADLARRRMRKHLEAEAEFLRGRRSTRQLLPDGVVLGELSNGKRAEAVARRITQQVVGDDLPPGALVGTEPELMQREDVSRAVLREAVRLLEHHEIARMRRGPGGGLFVVAPSPTAVTDIAAIFLARRGMTLADLAELRMGVEVALAGLAAERASADATARLHDALERERRGTLDERAEVVHDLHAAVAAGAQNHALELIALVSIRLSRLHQIEKLPAARREAIDVEVHRTHEAIAAAIETGDPDLAQRRMKRHLDVLGAVMRG